MNLTREQQVMLIMPDVKIAPSHSDDWMDFCAAKLGRHNSPTYDELREFVLQGEVDIVNISIELKVAESKDHAS